MKFEKDIFGNEFLGSKRVTSFTLSPDELPLGAQALLAIVEEAHLSTNINHVFADALREVSGDFWDSKLAELTPLEWKVLQAMKHPEFYERVGRLLAAFEQDLPS